MEYRALGKTGLKLPVLSFGASSMGAEFRNIDLNDAIKSLRVALDLGMNFIDTSPFYGRGMSEVLLGFALQGVKRDSYLLGTKLGRYSGTRFDFSARRVLESVEISLERMRVDHLDICLCHDIEFVDMRQIVEETIPMMRTLQKKGMIRYVGISGYPMNIFKYVLERTELDVILSYNHYTMQNTMLADLAPMLKQKGVDIAQLAVQYSIANADISTCIVGSANPENVKKWVEWAAKPVDQQLMNETLEILKPIHNWFYIEGRTENNDKPVNPLPITV
jgi:aryl-alcohol dehydrogenase-like predicted oxidoreductase